MEITKLISHPELMDRETLYELRSMVALYPYFQTARLLMLQNLYILHDPGFDMELRRAAIAITDRRKIFNMIEAAHYQLRKPQDGNGEPQGKQNANEDRTATLIDSFLDSIPADAQEEKKRKRKPTPADAAVDYVAYLLETETDDDRQADDESPKMKGQSLIDDFINNDEGAFNLKDTPEYTPVIDDSQDDKASDEGYFTDTLARIYIKQRNYNKALEIISRLHVKHPEKNIYYDDQVRFLRKLIKNENNNKNK